METQTQPSRNALDHSARRTQAMRIVATCGVGSAAVFSLLALSWLNLELSLKGLAALLGLAGAAAAFVLKSIAFVVTLGQKEPGLDVIFWLFVVSWLACVGYKISRSGQYGDEAIAKFIGWCSLPHLALALCIGVHMIGFGEGAPADLGIRFQMLCVSFICTVAFSFAFTYFALFCGTVMNDVLNRLMNDCPRPDPHACEQADNDEQASTERGLHSAPSSPPVLHSQHGFASASELRLEVDWTQRFARQARERRERQLRGEEGGQ